MNISIYVHAWLSGTSQRVTLATHVRTDLFCWGSKLLMQVRKYAKVACGGLQW